jgi:hypothetical protein
MRQAIVLAAVPIAVVGLPEEDEISWLGRSAHVDISMRLGVPVDRLHTAIPLPPVSQQIDPQRVEQGSDKAGAIAWVFLTPDLDRRSSQKFSSEGDQALALLRRKRSLAPRGARVPRAGRRSLAGLLTLIRADANRLRSAPCAQKHQQDRCARPTHADREWWRFLQASSKILFASKPPILRSRRCYAIVEDALRRHMQLPAQRGAPGRAGVLGDRV